MSKKKQEPKVIGEPMTLDDLEKTSKDNRARAFATVIYPESLPEDWLTRLKNTMWKGFVSPLHDKDIDENSGQPKKPHYHVLIMFGQNSKKNYETQIKPIFDQCFEKGYAGRAVIQSAQGYARYLCHLDNPEKYQYDKKDVIAFGGADYITTINCTEDNIRIQREMLAYIKSNNVVYFDKFVDWAMENNEEWFYFLTKNSYFIREILKAKNARLRDESKGIFYQSDNSMQSDEPAHSDEEPEQETPYQKIEGHIQNRINDIKNNIENASMSLDSVETSLSGLKGYIRENMLVGMITVQESDYLRDMLEDVEKLIKDYKK